jgi:hypothetical protein
MEFTRGPRVIVAAEILELLRLKVENGSLVPRFDRGEVQRVAQPAVHRDTVGYAPVVLGKILFKVGAIAYLILLQIDRELLDLPQQETRERRPRVCDAGQVGEKIAECEGPGR